MSGVRDPRTTEKGQKDGEEGSEESLWQPGQGLRVGPSHSGQETQALVCRQAENGQDGPEIENTQPSQTKRIDSIWYFCFNKIAFFLDI